MPGKIRSVSFATIVALAFTISPKAVDDARYEYAGFLAKHDAMHREPANRSEPESVVVRKAFWNDDRRILLVDAGSTRGKGDLLVLEGTTNAADVHAFRISSKSGAEFELAIPEDQSVPCQVVVRSAHLQTVADVENAPSACIAAS